jgi:preprotein translocase subunit SecE
MSADSLLLIVGRSRREAVTKANQKTKARSGRRPSSGRRKENAILRYFRQTWAELKKVRWPTRRELTNLSLIVLSVTVAMSAFLGVADRLSSLLFSFLIGLTG